MAGPGPGRPRPRPPLFWRLFAAFIAVNVVTLFVVGGSISYLMRSWLLDAKEAALAARLRSAVDLSMNLGMPRVSPQFFIEVMKPLLEIDEAFLVPSEYVLSQKTLTHPMAAGTFVLSAGDMDKLKQGYLVTKWLSGRFYSVPPLGVAVMLPQGALLVSAPLGDVKATLDSMHRLILLTGLGGTLLAAVLAFLLSRQIAAPLGRLHQLAKEFAGGDFSARAPVDVDDEIGQVAGAFNLAAERIQATLAQQQALMAQQLALMAQQQSLDQLRRDFMANVSHEFRAPLASLRGYLELMLDGTVRPEERSHVLQVMLDDSLRLGRLVDDLLDLARLQAKRVQLRKEPVDVLDVMDRVLTSFESRAAKKSISLVADPSPGQPDDSLPLVQADEDRLVQVLTNLIDNALRFTPENGSIEVRAEPRDGFVRLTVKDTGRGIPAEELPHIWDRFYKVDKARTPGEHGPEGGGTGLGLAIVQEIVTSLDGQVGCESDLGQGSTFWVEFPLWEESDAAPAE